MVDEWPDHDHGTVGDQRHLVGEHLEAPALDLEPDPLTAPTASTETNPCASDAITGS